MSTVTLSPAQVQERTGATYRQVDYWCRRGWLNVESRGTGVQRSWPLSELAAAATMARLVHAGLHPAVASRVAHGATQLAPGITVLIDRRLPEERA